MHKAEVNIFKQDKITAMILDLKGQMGRKLGICIMSFTLRNMRWAGSAVCEKKKCAQVMSEKT